MTTGPKPIHPYPYIVALYGSGLSTRQIAAMVGLSHGWVWMICKRAGMVRSTADARKLTYAHVRCTDPRSARSAARRVWQETNGKLPDGMVIHHRDGDCLNNDLNNLEALPRVDHLKLHHPHNPVPRHLRPQRREYMKAYLKKYCAEHPRRQVPDAS